MQHMFRRLTPILSAHLVMELVTPRHQHYPNAPAYILPTWHPIPEALSLSKSLSRYTVKSSRDKTAPSLINTVAHTKL